MTLCYRPWMESAAANAIFAALGGNARFVGGCVRDALLGKDAKDIDIATPITPEDVIAKLESNNIKVIPTGLKHGTVTAVINSTNFEITTLRRDIDCFGRHAEVEFTDNWEEDAARRDFTINAMSCSQKGEVFDYFGGIADLKKHLVRFVGDAAQRCREDYLRILRFFRFFSYYGKEQADTQALKACRESASGIEGLSGERIQSEMFKLLAAENPAPALQLMLEYGVMPYVIPSCIVDNIKKLASLPQLTGSGPQNPVLRLAVLIGREDNPAAKLAARWKLSNHDKTRLLFLCNSNNMLNGKLTLKSAKKLLRKWGKDNFLDICILAFAYGMEQSKFQELYSLSDWQMPLFPVTGNDLLTLGLKQGKELGDALRKAEEYWEDKDYNPGREEIIEFLKD